MRFSKVSVRYARALYALAEEYGQNEPVYEDMRMLSDVFAEAREIRVWMESPIIPTYLKQQAVRVFFKKRLDALSIRFINLIIAKNRSADVYGIIREYVAFYNAKKGISQAEVGTPYPLTAHEKALFSDWFARHLPDRKVELSNTVRPSLLGGFTLKVDGQYVDRSISGALQRFRRDLGRTEASGIGSRLAKEHEETDTVSV